jgi:hypothetical protein
MRVRRPDPGLASVEGSSSLLGVRASGVGVRSSVGRDISLAIPPDDGAPRTTVRIRSRLARIPGIVAVTGLLLLGMSPDASAQNPCAPSPGGNTTTATNTTITIVNATNKTEQVATFLTRLTARLDGGALAYDQSFPAAFSDPTVQAAITQARRAITTAAAPATPTLTGPTRLTTATSTDTVVKTVDVVDLGVSPNPDVKVAVNIGPATIMVGPEQSVVCTIAPGGMNINTLITTTLARTVTTTTTTLTTEHWQLEGTTTPATTYTQYLAEGATSAFFDTQLALLNPGSVATTATLTFTPANAPLVVTTVPVPAHTRVTVTPKTIAGLAVAEFSTKVESAERLVVDRTMTWDATGYGAHAETAVSAPAPTWYLAEGATHSGFDLFYLLQNPNPTATTARVRYLRPTGAPLEKTYTLPPTSRTNIWVNLEDFPGLGRALASTDVSAVLDTLDGAPIIVERAMYLSTPAHPFNAGHESMGVTAPALNWFLAEGATGPYFDLFLLIANPNPQDAAVTVTYLLTDGRTYGRTLTAPANSRSNIWVDLEQIPGEPGLPLADVALSSTVASTNGVPIIVERAMWWPGDGWIEGHNSAGATTTGTMWALAEGEVGGARHIETYLLIANTSATAGSATVTLYFEDGTSAARTYDLLPRSRTNVAVAADFGAAVTDTRFGAMVESTGNTPAQIVVERAMYSDASGVRWAAGTNAQATKLR